MRKILIVAASAGLLFIVAAASAQPLPTAPREATPDNGRCRAAVERRLTEWGGGHERYRDADGPFGARQWRVPTHEIGTWLLLHEPADGTLAVARVDERSTTRVTFDAQCHEAFAMIESSPIASVAGDVFTDGHVRALLAGQPQGVVYLWSPHMPLSVDGYRTVREVASRLGMSFTALRDPLSDPGYAAAVAGEAGLPAEALRTFSSIELGFRQLSLHAPALLVFARGRFAGLAVPGYREAAGFEAAIAERLRSMPPSDSSRAKEH